MLAHKYRFIVLGLLLSLMVSSCALSSKPSLSSRIDLLSRGMSADEVQTILGTPSQKHFDEQNDIWDYYRLTKAWRLTFSDGKLIRLEPITPPRQNSAEANRTHQYQATAPTPAPYSYRYSSPYPPTQHREQDYYPSRRVYTLSDADFNSLHTDIVRLVSTEKQLNRLQMLSQEYSFTAHQVRRLIDLFVSSERKLSALQMLAHSIEGTPLRYQVIEAFTFKSTKEKARRILIDIPSEQLLPARNVDFDHLLSYIKKQSFKDEKLEVISLVAHSSIYTTEQAVRLIKLFTFDDDKMTVLRLIAANLANSGDRHRILDLLSFSDSQREARQLLRLP